MAAALEEPLKQEVSRGIQEGLLTVWGADVLGRTDPCRVLHFLARGEKRFSDKVLQEKDNTKSKS